MKKGAFVSTESSQKTTAPNSIYSKELEKKFELLNDFEIKKESIPNGYFANLRSQRDLDLRAKELIWKKIRMI